MEPGNQALNHRSIRGLQKGPRPGAHGVNQSVLGGECRQEAGTAVALLHVLFENQGGFFGQAAEQKCLQLRSFGTSAWNGHDGSPDEEESRS